MLQDYITADTGGLRLHGPLAVIQAEALPLLPGSGPQGPPMNWCQPLRSCH